MSRILNYIAKYDENLTIAQLKEAIELEQKSEKEEEEKGVNTIVKDFSNTYLKKLDEHSLFGRTLRIYNLRNYIRSERTTDWNLTYYFEGTEIAFSERDIYKNDFNPDRCGNSFSEEELRSMAIITKEEYNAYNNHYEHIRTKLKDLIV